MTMGFIFYTFSNVHQNAIGEEKKFIIEDVMQKLLSELFQTSGSAKTKKINTFPNHFHVFYAFSSQGTSQSRKLVPKFFFFKSFICCPKIFKGGVLCNIVGKRRNKNIFPVLFSKK